MYFTENVERSTYRQIADSVRSSLGLSQELSGKSDGEWQSAILEAEEEITTLSKVQEEVKLRLSTTYDRYEFRENPDILTIAHNGTTALITTRSAHGLATGDIIRVYWSKGLKLFNGRRLRVTYVGTTSFTVHLYGRVTAASNETPVEITSERHGLDENAAITVAEVTGNTGANGGWMADVTGRDTIQLRGAMIDAVGNGEYISGGYWTVPITDGASYIGGGRWYLESEIPSFLKFPETLKYEYDGVINQIEIRDAATITATESADNLSLEGLNMYPYPAKALYHAETGTRYLRLYPAPAEDTDVTIYGTLQIRPAMFLPESFESYIHLRSEYEPLIRMRVTSTILNWLGRMGDAMKMYGEFLNALERSGRKRNTNIRMQVTYR